LLLVGCCVCGEWVGTGCEKAISPVLSTYFLNQWPHGSAKVGLHSVLQSAPSVWGQPRASLFCAVNTYVSLWGCADFLSSHSLTFSSSGVSHGVLSTSSMFSHFPAWFWSFKKFCIISGDLRSEGGKLQFRAYSYITSSQQFRLFKEKLGKLSSRFIPGGWI